MTWREKLENESPGLTCGIGGGFGCPHMHFKEATRPTYCDGGKACDRCWSRTIPGTESEPAKKTCGNCKHLEKMTSMEPCASCRSIGCDPTNWKPKDEPTLTASTVHYINNNINVTKEIADELERQMIKRALNSVYGNHQMFAQGRCNGKTYNMQRLIDSMLAAGNPVAVARKQHHDGLSAQLFTIDEMHSYKQEERKPDNMPTRSYTPYQIFGNITMSPAIPEIERVIFSDPATIVFWKDGTKTVVKAHNEEYDPEKGLAMAMIKKYYGNKGNYCNKLKKWTDKYRYYGETPAEKAERRSKQIREKLAYAEVMLDSIINEQSKLTKADLRAMAKDTRKLIGEALED